jgi:enamine deaminase RidA (YjgF/YER057c/UK114 family)
MNKMHNESGVAAQIGRYSDGMEAPSNARLLYTAGTPGLMPDGTLPKTMEAQAAQVWKNIQTTLEGAGMEVTDIVKVNMYVTRREDVQACVEARDNFLGGMRPASMLSIVGGFVRPEFLVEVEAYAAKV